MKISNFPATQAVTGTFTSSVPTYSVSGTITTQNLTPTRTATAGSAVLALCDGYATASIKVRGGYTGALTAQFSNDDSTWTTPSTNLLYRYTVSGAGASSSISSGDTSLYFMPTMGAKRIRLTGLSAMTGTATVFIVLNTANNIVYINPSQSVVVTNTLLASGASGGYKLEDAASASGDGGSFIMGIRSDTLTSTPSSANGDYTQFSVTKNGSLLTKDEMRHRVTYRASSGSFSPAALATDIFTISGVASKTIMITKIIFSATQTAGSTFNVALIKRSTANTSGTATAMTAVPLDASDAAAGSIVQYYTANPTLGTTIGSVETAPIFCSTTATQPEKYVFDFGLRSKPIILNSASQALSINLGGVTMTGGACFVTIEWTETW
jgi:phage baseplate assembly protein gpV